MRAKVKGLGNACFLKDLAKADAKLMGSLKTIIRVGSLVGQGEGENWRKFVTEAKEKWYLMEEFVSSV